MLAFQYLDISLQLWELSFKNRTDHLQQTLPFNFILYKLLKYLHVFKLKFIISTFSLQLHGVLANTIFNTTKLNYHKEK